MTPVFSILDHNISEYPMYFYLEDIDLLPIITNELHIPLNDSSFRCKNVICTKCPLSKNEAMKSGVGCLSSGCYLSTGAEHLLALIPSVKFTNPEFFI